MSDGLALSALLEVEGREGWDPWTAGAVLGAFLRRLDPSSGKDLPERLQAVYGAARALPGRLAEQVRDGLTHDLCGAIDDHPRQAEFGPYLERVAAAVRRSRSPSATTACLVPRETWQEMSRYLASDRVVEGVQPMGVLVFAEVDLGDGLTARFSVHNGPSRPHAYAFLLAGPQTLSKVPYVLGETVTFRRGGKDYVIDLAVGSS